MRLGRSSLNTSSILGRCLGELSLLSRLSIRVKIVLLVEPGWKNLCLLGVVSLLNPG